MSMTQPHISSSLVPEAADGTSSTFEAALPPSDDPPNILPKTVKPPIIPHPLAVDPVFYHHRTSPVIYALQRFEEVF